MGRTLPETMRRIRYDGTGGPEVIAVETAPVPKPGPGQVLIEVVAAGVNRPDVAQRAGSYPPPPAPRRFRASRWRVALPPSARACRVCPKAMRSAPW